MTVGTEVVELVDADGRTVGTAEKLEAHRSPGLRHRAISAFVFDAAGRTLVQRRALAKYHFAGLWSNSCCSHPRPGEAVADAARRRVAEELGVECQLTEVGTFVYRAEDPVSHLIEHEHDHVLIGLCSGEVRADPGEVDEVVRLTLDELAASVGEHPDRYTPWLAAALDVVRQAALPTWAQPPPTSTEAGC